MLLVEELAARGWPAAKTLRADGWLLRHTPSLTRRRSNSALPVGDTHGDPALVEDFYARRGSRALVQVSPAEAWTSLDRDLARRGWSSLGVGLAVCERGWAGLFCVATAASARRRGIARGVVHALTRWAAEGGAQRIYLQVETDNVPGHAFYASAGFQRSHGYHYRRAPR